MIEVVVAVLFVVLAVANAWATRDLVGRLEESHRKEADWLHAALADALDRIQAPSLEEYKAQAAPVDWPEIPEYLYDPTGLVEVEAEGNDERVE